MSAPYLDVEGADRAAIRLERAALSANSAADRLEEATRQIRFLTEDGYGNNVCRLIELLSKETSP